LASECWFYVDAFLPEELQDKFLREVVRPLNTSVLEEGSFDRFFFVRYNIPSHHLRLRWFGPRSCVLGQPREKVLARLRAVSRDFRPLSVDPARYRPEWVRYGGREGVRLAERIFAASSEAVLEFLELRHSRPKLSMAEFALVSGEALLDGLGVRSKARGLAFRRHPPRPEKVRPETSPILVKIAASAAANPRAYWSRRDQGVQRIIDRLYESLVPLRAAYRKLRRNDQAFHESVRSSYLHMHFTRLGLSRSLEDTLRAFRRLAQ
jgi:thiopeptide-type bacteriocin biosynthesis protein